ncbi:transmembrane protein 117-like [Tachypleus tridentatus]|uniref:transmembrane protein 117-like n=1 Tax=Tachypleus tridentatus TaxID=6853 RepID=UPI003FD38E43
MPLLLSPIVKTMCMMEQKERLKSFSDSENKELWVTATNPALSHIEDQEDLDSCSESEDKDSWVTASNLVLRRTEDQEVTNYCSDSEDMESWITATSIAIRQMEERCRERSRTFKQSYLEAPPTGTGSTSSARNRIDRPKSDSFVEAEEELHLKPCITRRTLSDCRQDRQFSVTFQSSSDPPARLALLLEDIRYIDDSTGSSVSTCRVDSWSSLFLTSPGFALDGFFQEFKLPGPVPLTKDHYEPLNEERDTKPDSDVQLSSKMFTDTPSCKPQWDFDSQSIYSLHMEKDFRYFFQHPYARLFVSYFVIFCNFLIFAEDPVSHSHAESEIPVVGNVFSFIATKYPPEWTWCLVKVALWLFAIVLGLEVGNHFIHHCLLRNIFRLKMFREEQGTWMIMFLTVIIFVYIFSLVYNTFLLSSYTNPEPYRITEKMGITNMSFMKVAASGTWLGDFFTAWMVTDMMLQDNLYVDWAKPARTFWKTHGRVRIVVFWAGSTIMTTLVVTLISGDWITWDRLNRDFVATTELSRAFLASFILVMDLLIVIQDWDFPHFVCDLDIKLPGMHVSSFKFRMFQKYVGIPDVVFHITGKWFNYGIIVVVMILDLNMWKNQIFYSPEAYGQYIGPSHKVYTVADQEVLRTGKATTIYSLDIKSINKKYTVYSLY